MSPQPSTQLAAASPAVDRTRAVAVVEQDRYCEHCGYNLHTQPVLRDERLDLLVIRCPECGRWHPALATHTAARPWMQRFGVLALFAWMSSIVALACLVMLLMGVVSYVTTESLTTWEAVYSPTATTTIDPQTGASVSQPVVTKWKRVPNERSPEYWLLMTLMTAFTMILALLWSVFSTVAMHHRRRVALAVVAALIPALPALWVRQIWWWDVPELLPWVERYIGWHLSVAVLCGVLGVWLGRALMRFAAVLLLPPRARAPLAFLWLADGMAPPVKQDAERS